MLTRHFLKVNVSLTVLAALAQAASPTWTQLAPTGGPPQARAAHSAVLDTSAGQMIIFAGAHLNDVWSLTTSASPQWTPVTTTGVSPPARVGHTAVYDSANSRMIIFGGGLGNTSPCANDVWVLSNVSQAAAKDDHA